MTVEERWLASEITPGEPVVLASGGPLMTLEIIHPNGTVQCSWMEGADRRKGYFLHTSLRRLALIRWPAFLTPQQAEEEMREALKQARLQPMIVLDAEGRQI